jgi:hypothetical protein
MLTYATSEPVFHFGTIPDVITGETTASSADKVRAAMKWSWGDQYRDDCSAPALLFGYGPHGDFSCQIVGPRWNARKAEFSRTS